MPHGGSIRKVLGKPEDAPECVRLGEEVRRGAGSPAHHLTLFLFLFETKITEDLSDGSCAFGGNENSRFYANSVSGSFEPAVS